jgi:hypothetical protein
MKVALVRAAQVSALKSNPTAAHLKVEFVLPEFLPDGDLHVLTTSDKGAVESALKAIADAGGDISATLAVERARRR